MAKEFWEGCTGPFVHLASCGQPGLEDTLPGGIFAHMSGISELLVLSCSPPGASDLLRVVGVSHSTAVSG